jgi:dihydrofolate synthase/folylpolyglutamate synthase
VIARVAAARGSPLLVGGVDWRLTGDWRAFDAVGPWGALPGLRLALPGNHQVENAGVALAALWALRPLAPALAEPAIRAGLAGVRWPGRFERVDRPGQPPIILDGAHTALAAAALADAVAAEAPGRRLVVLLGVSADKDPLALLRPLAPQAAAVIATQADHPRALPAAALAANLSGLGPAIETIPAVATALARAASLAGDDGLILVTGSLFVVATARQALGLAVPDPTIE